MRPLYQGGLALVTCVAAACAPEPRITVEAPDGTVFTPCSTGCAAPEPEEDHTAEVKAHLAAVAALAVGTESVDLDSLLFHGDETRVYLDAHGSAPLSDAHTRWLRRELDRDRVDVGFRLVASDGRVLGHHDDRFPFVEHQDFVLSDTGPLGRVSMNGKVKRVGVAHLWARF